MKGIIIVMLLMIMWPPVLRAGSETTGEVLEIGVGRNTALGGAGLASIRTPAALHYNPAGLARMRPGYYQFSYQRQIEDVGMGNVDIGGSWGETYLGGGMKYLNYGSADRLVYDEDAGLEGELVREGSFTSSDVVLSGGAARSYGSLTYGGVLRGLRMQIDDEQAQGFAMDLGVQYRWGEGSFPIYAGGVVKNIGTGVKFVEESEELPLLVRGGVTGYMWPRAQYMSFGMHMDVEQRMEEGELDYMVGMEWEILNRFTVMGGYDGRNEAGDKLTLGLGMILLEEWNLPGHYMGFDYSLADRGELGSVHQFTISVYPR